MASLSIYLDLKKKKREKVGQLKMSITVQLHRENCQQPGTCAFNVKPLVSKNKSEAAQTTV